MLAQVQKQNKSIFANKGSFFPAMDAAVGDGEISISDIEEIGITKDVNMVAEPNGDDATGSTEKELAGMFREFMKFVTSGGMGATERKGDKGVGKGDVKRVVLEERYSRRVEKFSGDGNKFRGWIFDIVVAAGSVDSKLAEQIEGLLNTADDEDLGAPDKWNPLGSKGMDEDIYEKYRS